MTVKVYWTDLHDTKNYCSIARMLSNGTSASVASISDDCISDDCLKFDFIYSFLSNVEINDFSHFG